MKEVVEKVENEETEISLQEAIEKSGEQLEIGDEFIEEITLDNIGENFGRRLITLASQGLNQRIRDIEKENIYNEYIDRVGEIIVGEVYQIRRNDILVMHNKVELRLPREEQIPNETYKGKKNQTIKALLKEVRRGGSSGVPELILSRASDEFLAKLFEVEIPEIYDGIIVIKAIARDPGERSKVAVMSTDDRVDPVGACVGMKGIRIHSIVRELNNENIDLIEYSDNPKVFIAKALLPAKIKEITISEETRTATVVVSEDQVPLAIGKNGQNVRLASKLTGYSITLIKEGGEDIELVEFKEELGLALFQELKALRIETAREFLEYDIGKLLKVKGMTKDLLIEMRSIILAEFDETESQEMLDRINNYEIKEDDEPVSEQENQDTHNENKDDEIILDFEE
jgi:N utilization substance protein A